MLRGEMFTMKKNFIYETTPEERDAIFEKYREEYTRNLENNNIETRGPKYRFKTGGGFWYSEGGGPSISGSLALSLPAPFNAVSFSMNLGNKSTSGAFVNVPDTEHHYKLYIERKFEIRPYATYRASVGSNKWELYNSGAVAVSVGIDPSAKRVD